MGDLTKPVKIGKIGKSASGSTQCGNTVCRGADSVRVDELLEVARQLVGVVDFSEP